MSARPEVCETAEERLWARVDRRAPGECWEWTGARSAAGYGQISIQAVLWYTHRLAYVATFGPIPPNQSVCHRCDNPPCCNPAHLFVGSQRANARDMMSKGRRRARLTPDAVREIRRLYAAGPIAYGARTELARRFGVHVDTINLAARGETWGHVSAT